MPLSQTDNQDSSGSIIISGEGVDGSVAPVNTLQIGGKDQNGNLQTILTDPSGQVAVRDLINVASQQQSLTVSTTAVQALGGATILAQRKLLTITPTSGTIYWSVNSGVTTSTGFPLFANQTLFLSFSSGVPVYLISTAANSVIVMEAS